MIADPFLARYDPVKVMAQLRPGGAGALTSTQAWAWRRTAAAASGTNGAYGGRSWPRRPVIWTIREAAWASARSQATRTRRSAGLMSADSRRGPATGLVDRRSECAMLDRLIEAVRAGKSRALVVRGDPGVGKTLAVAEHHGL